MKICRILRTVKCLRFIQILYQLYYRLHKVSFREARLESVYMLQMEKAIYKSPCLNNGVFSFLNIESRFPDWNDTSHGMLWVYNLNYMDWLYQQDMTFDEGAKWIDCFIAEQLQNRVGLDPYPIALRGINWIKFIVRFRDSIDEEKFKEWSDFLYSQYVLLTKRIEYHLLGNHLLEDACSLFIASIFFHDEKIYRKASRLLFRELQEQLLSDGAHFEQSPMYHCILLDRLLDCYNISQCNLIFMGQDRAVACLREKAELMLGHLENICNKDGSLPLFNDSAYGIAPTAQQIKEYAKLLGIEWKPKVLGECGYRKFENNRMEAFVDVGNITASYQPGHSHADTFNYELRIDGMPFIVDTGISTYNKTERRQYERSTVAHNTVTIAGKDSSEVWGGFRVGRRAKVKITASGNDFVEAFHDGFGRAVIHKRRFEMTEHVFSVIDHITGGKEAVSRIHFSPDVQIYRVEFACIVTNLGIVRIEGANRIDIDDCLVSKEYNKFGKAKVASITFLDSMKYTITV